jgi:hypothetical protein
MVINPRDYSKSYTDTDLDNYNINLTKKKRIKNLPDVNFANKVAKHIEEKLGLDLQVCHNLGEDINSNDFIFARDSWLDPGEPIDCRKILHVDL